MFENKDTDLEQKFSQWLEERTSQKNQNVKDDYLVKDTAWQERASTARYIANQVDEEQEYEVPHWDRGSAFESTKASWWQWSGLPVFSLAFSFFAIALVLLRVEVVVKPEGLMLSFFGKQQAIDDERIARLVDQKLQSFANEQQVVLANYAADIKEKQQESNLQLASYVMEASRQERKEDMNDFINYINDQRAEEQYTQKAKFQQLERAIKYQQTNLQQIPSNIGLQPYPADWSTEE